MSRFVNLERDARMLHEQLLAQQTPAERAAGVLVWNGARVSFQCNDPAYAAAVVERVSELLAGDTVPHTGDENSG